MELLAQAFQPGPVLQTVVAGILSQAADWLRNAQVIQTGLFAALMLIVIGCRIGVVGAKGGGAAAIPWAFIGILQELIVPVVVVGSSFTAAGGALNIGMGLGQGITGLQFAGATGLFFVFLHLIFQILILPFSAGASTGLPGAIGFGAAIAIATSPLQLGLGLLILGAIFSLWLLKVAVDCTRVVIMCQVETVIIMPWLLVLTAFVAIPGDGMWKTAIATFWRSIFRLSIAIGISALAVGFLQRIVTTIAGLGATANLYTMALALFGLVGAAVIIGSLVEGLPRSIDAAFSGNLNWGGGASVQGFASQIMAVVKGKIG